MDLRGLRRAPIEDYRGVQAPLAMRLLARAGIAPHWKYTPFDNVLSGARRALGQVGLNWYSPPTAPQGALGNMAAQAGLGAIRPNMPPINPIKTGMMF